MSHNKMYREIEGYEDAFYATTEAMNLLTDVLDDICYGDSKESVNLKIDEVQKGLEKIRFKLEGKTE